MPRLDQNNSTTESARTESARTESASQALSNEAHQNAPDASVAGTRLGRVGQATVEALNPVNLASGVGNAIFSDYEHPMQTVEMLGTSAVLGAALKTVLPEGGPVAIAAGLGIGGYFLYQSLKPMAQAVGDAANAKTTDDIDDAAQKMDNTLGSFAVNSAISGIGYKAGAAAADYAMGSKMFDGFTQAKADFWNSALTKLNLKSPDIAAATAATAATDEAAVNPKLANTVELANSKKGAPDAQDAPAQLDDSAPKANTDATTATKLNPVLEGIAPPKTLNYIEPRDPVQPFYQWNNNDGYCGEVSMLQAGLDNGQWMSQYNARLITGSGLSQAGTDSFLQAHPDTSDFNAQASLERAVPGDGPFSSIPEGLTNARLDVETFDKSAQLPGMDGYQQYMSWVKGQVIAGHQVMIGIADKGADTGVGGLEYDHIVSVAKIGTNHAPTDASYYGDDVLYLEDHGELAFRKNGSFENVHPGVPSDVTTPTDKIPYIQGYQFDSLAKTREGANLPGANEFSILIPGKDIPTLIGGDGINPNPQHITSGNYAVAVTGPMDTQHVTLPVNLKIEGSSVDGVPNPQAPTSGFNYENPMIGTDLKGNDATNVPPSSWMDMQLRATVNGTTPGKGYNLYEYDFDGVSGTGGGAALKVPTSDFNAQAGLASSVTHFTADGKSWSKTVQTPSNKVVVFRTVTDDAS